MLGTREEEEEEPGLGIGRRGYRLWVDNFLKLI